MFHPLLATGLRRLGANYVLDSSAAEAVALLEGAMGIFPGGPQNHPFIDWDDWIFHELIMGYHWFVSSYWWLWNGYWLSVGIIYWSLSMGIMVWCQNHWLLWSCWWFIKSKTKWNMCIFCFNFPKYFLCVFWVHFQQTWGAYVGILNHDLIVRNPLFGFVTGKDQWIHALPSTWISMTKTSLMCPMATGKAEFVERFKVERAEMTWSIWFEMLWISRSRALVFSFLHLSSLVITCQCQTFSRLGVGSELDRASPRSSPVPRCCKCCKTTRRRTLQHGGCSWHRGAFLGDQREWFKAPIKFRLNEGYGWYNIAWKNPEWNSKEALNLMKP